MMLPVLIVLILNDYLPMFGIVVAFQDIRYGNGLIQGILHGKWVGLKNFEFFTATPDAFLITRNTVLYNGAFIVLDLVFSVGLAYLIHELGNRRLSNMFHTIILMPHFLSFVVVSYIVYAFLHVELGFVNRLLQSFPGADPVRWYQEPAYWPFILSLVHVWKYVGYNSIVYLAALKSIDPQLYEAATIDGAGKWKQARHVTLPLLVPLMIVLTLLEVGKIFYSDFGLFYQVPLDSGPLFPVTNVLDTYVYRSLVNMGDISMAAAAGVYQAFVGFVLVLGANWLVRRYDKSYSLF